MESVLQATTCSVVCHVDCNAVEMYCRRPHAVWCVMWIVTLWRYIAGDHMQCGVSWIVTLWRVYCRRPHAVWCVVWIVMLWRCIASDHIQCGVSCGLCLYLNIVLFSIAGHKNFTFHHCTIDSVKTALLIISQAAVKWSLIAKTCSRCIKSENLYSCVC